MTIGPMRGYVIKKKKKKKKIPKESVPKEDPVRCGGANDGRTPNLGCTQEPRRKPLLHRRSCVRWRE